MATKSYRVTRESSSYVRGKRRPHELLDMPATRGNLLALLSVVDAFATDSYFDNLVSDDYEGPGIYELRAKLHECFSLALDLRGRTGEERERESYDRAHEFDKDAA